MPTLIQSTARPLRSARPAPGLFARAMTMLAVHRQRAQLRKLDNIRLRDLGLTRDEALLEASRPFWDVPATWRK